jgi:hypothetical protein
MDPEYMKEVCEQIAEIRRVVKETKKHYAKTNFDPIKGPLPVKKAVP